MAISPSINPQSIVGNRPKSIQSFQKFISGDSPLGSSVVSSAVNNIVGFQRASVRPAAPDINSIVSTISSNILNQVNNSIKNATNIINRSTDAKIQSSQNQILTVIEKIKPEQNNQVTQLQTVVKNIQNQTTNVVEKISEDYKKRINSIDSAKPNNLLSNFIDLYKTALDFIKFFGDRRNIDSLRDNLVSLRESFTESFEVAKLIRNTILKIFSQLSSLPKAGPGSSSGLNIDVNVPSGGPRKALPRGVSPGKMKGRLGLLGLGLGGAAMGGAAINALENSRDQAQSIQKDTSIPGQLIDTFGYLISRFANAVDEMIHGGEKSQSRGSSSASASVSTSSTRGGGGGGGSQNAGTSGQAVMPGTDQDLYTLATIAGLESGSAQGQADVAQAVYNRMSKDNTSATDILTRTGQFEPAFTAPYKISGGAVDPAAKQIRTFEDAVNFRMKKTGEKRETAEAAIRATIANLQNPSLQQNAASFIGARTSFRANANSYGRLSNSIWRGTSFDNQYLNEEVSGKGTAPVPTFVSGGQPKLGVGGENTPDWVLSPQKKEDLKLKEQMISQPPPSQTELPKITTLPLDLSGGTTGGQQSAAGPIPAPTRSGAPGPQIPYIPSANPENFLVLYSKIVYNIVDA